MQKKSGLFFLMLMVVVLALSTMGAPVFAENGNLLKNPGFEQLANNFPADWAIHEAESVDQVTIEASTKAPYSGSNCLVINNAAMRDSMAIQTVNVKKDKVYQISCWVRAENILNDAGSANVTLYYDNNGINCKGIITSPELQNTNNQWSKIEFKFRTLKISDPLTVGVRLGGQGTVNQGIAYFDDLTLQESDDSGDVLTFFIPGASSGGGDTTGSSGPNKVIIYVILGILAIGLLVFLESKLGKKGKNNETQDETEEDEEDEEEADEEEEEVEEVEEEEQAKKK